MVESISPFGNGPFHFFKIEYTFSALSLVLALPFTDPNFEVEVTTSSRQVIAYSDSSDESFNVKALRRAR